MSTTSIEHDTSTSKRILVVEDEQILALDLRQTLEEMGYAVCGTAATAARALASARKQRPDLVLMDIRLRGDLDGIEAAAQLREQARIPIVFLTAHTDDDTTRRALGVEPEGYLSKPFSRESLHSTIELALQQHDRKERLRESNADLASQNEALEQHSRELLLIEQMTTVLQSCETTLNVLRSARDFGERLLPHDCGVLFCFNESRSTLYHMASWGKTTMLASFNPEACYALQQSAPYTWSPSSTAPRCPHLTDPGEGGSMSGEGSSICIPMLAAGQPEGVLLLKLQPASSHDPKDRARKERTGVSLSHQVALSLANVRTRERLESESRVDPLTGLFNRRHLQSVLQRELSLATRNERPLSVILLDLDYFKQLNDTFGHVAADTALTALGSFLHARLRSYDSAFRYGGDELLIILPETSVENARCVAEQVRAGIEALNLNHEGIQLPQLSASCAVAAYPSHGREPGDLLQAVDRALYQAKVAGRNCVIVAGDARIAS